jgi:predicted small metal-binding protein
VSAIVSQVTKPDPVHGILDDAAREAPPTLFHMEDFMTKVVRCRDAGFDCDGVVRAETEDKALEKVAAHAKEAHGIDEVSPEMVEKVKSIMRDEA